MDQFGRHDKVNDEVTDKVSVFPEIAVSAFQGVTLMP